MVCMEKSDVVLLLPVAVVVDGGLNDPLVRCIKCLQGRGHISSIKWGILLPFIRKFC